MIDAQYIHVYSCTVKPDLSDLPRECKVVVILDRWFLFCVKFALHAPHRDILIVVLYDRFNASGH